MALVGGMALYVELTLHEPLTIAVLASWLRNAPPSIGMTPISEPMVAYNVHGLSGAIILAESHCSVHEVGDIAYVDMFSCKRFDVEDARRAAGKLGVVVEGSVTVIQRPVPPVTSI